MYRIFCESYKNFKTTIDEKSYRLEVTKPFELIADVDRYREEKNKQSMLYKQISDLVTFMKENITRYPKFKAFLWTLSSRNINPHKYEVAKKEDLEEQAKLLNSFLKLAYWY